MRKRNGDSACTRLATKFHVACSTAEVRTRASATAVTALGVEWSEVHVERAKPLEMHAQSREERVVVARFGRRPQHLGHCAESRPDHVLEVARVGYELRPELRLRAEDVRRLLGLERARHGLVAI